ncbi:hypothetical protein BY458DRAFT_496368 [Sporodiniella umbellata]|nr:hypothetical protein BY458DRAFT_496368 [Sporodiniella umbellata]
MATRDAPIPICQGCSGKIVEGEAVAFGNCLFHTECFICNKCRKHIDNKKNLLLLNNNSPLCDDCSFVCTVCNKGIQNEAIIADEKAYHSDCFKCISCKNQIKDLIFTQTKRGVYCSSCYELRKSSGKFKKKPTPLNELPPRSLPEDPPTPVRSRKNSNYILNTEESLLSVLSPVTLSFFNNDSSDLLDNLSSSLGANLCLNFNSQIEDATQFRISRASEILQSSLRTSSLKYNTETSERDLLSLDTEKLKKELSEARSNLKELESDYEMLQKASQQALEEFAKVKEEYAKEVEIKRQQELIIASLLKTNQNGLLSKKELDKLAKFRAQLESVCSELVKYRDMLSFDIEQTVDKKLHSAYYASYQKGLKLQVSSVAQQRSMLHFEAEELKSTRTEVIQSLYDLAKVQSESEKLNTENRRASDADSIGYKVSSRNSVIGDPIPTLFQIKKKSSTVFNKLTNGAIPKSNTKLKLETSVSSSSTVSSPRSPSIYGMSPRYNNSSSQNLHKKQDYSEASMSFQGTHSFVVASFLRPVRCGVCADKLWGRSEYKCEGCGFLAHSKCLNQALQNCAVPGLTSQNSLEILSDSSLTANSDNRLPSIQGNHPVNASIFGASLVDRAKFEGRPVPLLVEKCVEAIEKRGLNYEGIYRKSGGAAQTKAIQIAFDRGQTVDLCNEDDYNDICAITSALKQYFRELPNPLITFESYEELIKSSKIISSSERLHTVIGALVKLPEAHKHTLVLILNHLAKIYDACSQNRMTVKSLSMIFAPTLMRHQDPSRDFIDMSSKNSVVEHMLLNTADLQQTILNHS